MVRHPQSSAAHSSRTQSLAGAVVALGALSLVAACGGSSKPAASHTPAASVATSSAAPSATETAAPTGAASSEPTPSPVPSTAVVGPADCQSVHLALQAGQSQGAAGSTIATFVLRNAGSAPCSLFGFPGVSFLNASGAQVGPAAIRQGTPGARVIVQPGQVASFQVKVAVAACSMNSPQSTTIRVFPPNQRAALEAPGAFPICTAPGVTAVKSGITQ